MQQPRCTPAYAPRKVVAVDVAHEQPVVAPSHDIWALGVVA